MTDRRRLWSALLLGALAAALLGGLALYGASAALAPDAKGVLSVPASPMVTDRYGEPLRVYLAPDGSWSLPLSLDDMGPWLPRVAVAVEDRRFHRHPGVDLPAVFRAAWQNLRAGRVVSGASTITSQLIRLWNPRPRTLPVKALEFLQALGLERRASKERILQAYLNRAPFGGNTRGVEAAALSWFGRHARDLGPAEAALLIGMLQAPANLRPDRHPRRASWRRDRILEMLVRQGLLSAERLRREQAAPLPERQRSLPCIAPLAAERVRRQNGGTTIHTTLDRSLQRRLDGLLETALEPYPPSVTAAGIVVEHASGAVRAYVGNARWGSGLPGSWVDCGVAPRSPGSALKPFAYGLAYQRGLLTPSSLVADTPLGFPGAPPENFDRAFRGPMSAGEALATSRNIPAIRVLRMAGYGPFLGFLRRAGFRHIGEDPGHYGDGLVLGGVEVTLLEMARAYASIARRGGLSSLRWTGGEAAPEIPLWNPGAAYLLLRSLAGTEHLPPGVRQSAANAGAPALKTGTSSGFRDAWAAACSKRYTVVLWFGDPEGDTVARLVGSRTAVPAAFRLLQALEARSPCGDPPPCVVRREVCALSGAPPGRACPVTREGLSIRGISPVEHCGLHVVRDGRVVVDVPADLEGYLAGGDRGGRPARRLRILSPVAGETLILPEGRDALSVPLRAQGAGKRYWFVDGRLAAVQQAGDGAVFVTLGPGRHRIGVGTEAGAADGLSVEVATEQGSPPEVIE